MNKGKYQQCLSAHKLESAVSLKVSTKWNLIFEYK